MRGLVIPLTQAQIAARALSMIGYCPDPPLNSPEAKKQAIRYRLKGGLNGGFDPTKQHPASWSADWRVYTCDCSGFVAWCCGYDRKQATVVFPHEGGYVNTDAMVADSETTKSLFAPMEKPEVGFVIVYDADEAVGHTGIITAVPAEWDPKHPQFDLLKVTHCSSGNSKKFKAAIRETSGSPWANKDSRILQFKSPAVWKRES